MKAYRGRRFVLIACLCGFLCLARSDVASAQPRAVNIGDTFSPSGWMGDGMYGRKYVQMQMDHEESPMDADIYRFTYRFGRRRFAGVCWFNRPDNWGDQAGNRYSGSGFNEITFWAKGDRGGEVVEFKAGILHSSDKPYKDSYSATAGRVRLTTSYRQYRMRIEGTLESAISGFCWVASQDFNSGDQIGFSVGKIRLAASSKSE